MLQRAHYRVERSFGSFSRSLTLPEGIEADRIKASFDKGVLEVRIPKPEQRSPHKLAIEVAGTKPPIETTAEEASTAA